MYPVHCSGVAEQAGDAFILRGGAALAATKSRTATTTARYFIFSL